MLMIKQLHIMAKIQQSCQSANLTEDCVSCDLLSTASAKMQHLLKDSLETGIKKLREKLSSCRRLTLCVDGWTKKGLSASFLGISARFFDTTSSKPQHALLSLDLIQHPHTGEKLCECLERCLNKWEIPEQKVMLVISDNGSNMIKAVRLLREGVHVPHDDVATEELMEVSEDNLVDLETEELDDEEASVLGYAVSVMDDSMPVPYRRMGCLAHSLQLLIKDNGGQDSQVVSCLRENRC